MTARRNERTNDRPTDQPNEMKSKKKNIENQQPSGMDLSIFQNAYLLDFILLASENTLSVGWYILGNWQLAMHIVDV